jgi:hypothetical protein
MYEETPIEQIITEDFELEVPPLETAPQLESAVRTARTKLIEAIEVDDGSLVIPAEGSVWQLYFPAGMTPTEDQMRIAIGSLGAVKAMQAGNVAYTSWDASANTSTTDVVNFAGVSIIDHKAREEAAQSATRAQTFNELVNKQAGQLVSDTIAKLATVVAEQAAKAAEAVSVAVKEKAEAQDALAFAEETEVLLREERNEAVMALEAVGIDLEKSVLPEKSQPINVDGEGLITDVTVTLDETPNEKRKA